MSRLTYIDGLRGLAIALVFLRHYYMYAYEFGLPRWADAMSFGGVGVHLFLLLSGFCIGYRYVGPKAKPFEWGDFWKRRLQRILPAYYFVLLFCLVFMGDPKTGFWAQFIPHALMLHNLNPQTVLALNMPFWSLALECQLYLLFPLFLKLQSRWGTLGMLGVILLAQMFYRSLFLGMDSRAVGSMAFVLPWGVLGRMFEFTLGVAVATWLQEKGSESFSIRRPYQALLFGAIPVLLYAALKSDTRLDMLHPLTDMCWSLCFFCVLLLASVHKSLLQRCFEWKPLVFLGQMSYTVYLTHNIIMHFVFTLGKQYFSRPLVAMAPASALTLLGCYIIYRLIEKPAMDYFARARKPKASATAALL
jgi:peptidoglycan/LPS O-acetylase OafA/YrhL